MKTYVRFLMASMMFASWIVACGDEGGPTNTPVMTGAAGVTGGYPNPTGAAGTASPTGAAGTSGGMGAGGAAAGTTGGAAGTRGGGAAGTMGGAAGTTGGAAGTRGSGGAGTTGGAAGTRGGGAAGTTGGAAGTMGGGAAGTTGGAAGTMGGGAGTGGGAPTRAQVQAILSANCTQCHGNSGGLSLANVATVVGSTSMGCPTKTRIVAGSPSTSYLVDKIMGASQAAGGCFMGQRMPRGRPALSAANINTIVSWIAAGAP